VNKVRAYASDLRCIARDQGQKAALADVWTTVSSRFYEELDLIVLVKELSDAEPEAHDAVRVEEGGRRHLPLLAEFNRRQRNTWRTRRFATGLAEGKRVLLGFRDQELIGYFWCRDAAQAANGDDLSEFGLKLAEDEVFGYDLFIASEHRGRGVPVAFLAGVERALARLGYRRMLGRVEGANVPARWLYATSGYEVVRRRRARRILRRFMLVEGEGWLVSGRDGLRPLPWTPSSGRRT
jgi:GNAT superfamily N-acetyltransferase